MPKGLCFADVPFYFNSSLGDQLSQNVLTDLHQIFRIADVPFYFNSSLGDQLSQNVLTDLHQIFRIGTHMGGRDHSDLLFPITQWTLLW